jgi:localization factor PodJL
MRPDLPWNVAGIPPEAREAARAAARREGLPVGEWLTRRILREISDLPGGPSAMRDALSALAQDEPPVSGRDTGDNAGRSETDANSAYRRVEDQLRAIARGLEASQRSQSEDRRAMSNAAAEINIAARGQARAFDQLGASVANLTGRIERIERRGSSAAMKEAVKALHYGLTRLAEQVAQTASQSASQISALADNLESASGKYRQAQHDAEALSHTLEDRLSRLDERVQAMEKGDAGSSQLANSLESWQALFDERMRAIETMVERQGSELERALAAAGSIARIQEDIGTLHSQEQRAPQSDTRLHDIERTLAGLVARSGELQMPRASEALEDEPELPAHGVEDSETHEHELAELAASRTPVPDFVDAPTSDVAPTQESSEPPFDAVPDPVLAIHDDTPSPEDEPESFLAPEPSFETAALFGGEPASVTPAATSTASEDFLAAVRRSAQSAAAQAEEERGARGAAGFAWNMRSDAGRRPQTRYGLIGLAVLSLVLLIVAVILFSQRPENIASRSGHNATIVAQKPAATRKTSASSPTSGPAPSNIASSNAPSAAPAESEHSTAASEKSSQDASSSPTLPAEPPRSTTINRAPEVKSAASPAATLADTPSAASALQASASPRQIASMPALDRLSALANAGNPKAEMIVGLKYLDGDGVTVNESEAAKWLERAAEHGQAVAQYRLGTLYERGRGIPADPAKALHWYQVAADAGNRKAMHNLAVSYAQGTGTAKDFAEAARWFSKAATLGLADSQFNLAVLYERGLGVPQSLLDAYKWYAIAAANGDSESKSRIDALATQLSADDRAAAQRSADQFKPAPLNAAVNVPPQMSELGG